MENSQLEEVFAKTLKALRIEKGLTQSELAQAVNLTQRKISKLETIQLCPTLQMLADLSKYFSVSTDYLLGLKDY